MRPLIGCALLALLAPSIGCSGDDNGKGGTGTGLGSGATSGAAGSGNLAIGGKSGRGGAGQGGAGQGGAGQGGAGQGGAGQGGAGQGGAGQGGAGQGGAGQGGAGQGGGGQSGSGGGSGGFRPSTAVCGNGVLEPGERCDGAQGTTTDISCADLLGDPLATGTPSCEACFPSFVGCVSCKDGAKNGTEVDIDCGKASGCGLCGLGLACATSDDCASGLACVGGVCNDVTIEVPANTVKAPQAEADSRVPLVVRSALPLPSGVVAKLSGPGLSLEGGAPLALDRLVARVPTGSQGLATATLSLDNHVFPLTLPVRPDALLPTLSVVSASGRLGACAATPGAEIPLVVEANPTGGTPALELPMGRAFCLNLVFSTVVKTAITVSIGGSNFSQSPNLNFTSIGVDITLPPTPTFEARSGNTPIELAVALLGAGVAGVSTSFVVSPFTTRAGATGAGTTSSPAAPTYDFTAMGAPFAKRTVWQIAGPHPVSKAGLVLPENLVVQGIDGGASFESTEFSILNPTPIVKLGKGGALHDLAIVGPSVAAPFSGTCLEATGPGASLRGVSIRRCAKGVSVAPGAGIVFAGKGESDLTDVTYGVSGEDGASFVGIGLGVVGDSDGKGANALLSFIGFAKGSLALVRPKITSFRAGIDLGAKGSLDMVAPDITVGVGGLLVHEGGTAHVSGGAVTTTLPGANTLGVATDATLIGRGLRVVGGESSCLSTAGGTIDVTATVLRECGGGDSAAVASHFGGSLIAHGLRIEKPGQIGVFALGESKSVSLTGAVIESGAKRSLWILGGKLTLRTVLLRDPVDVGLDFGDPAEPVDVDDLDIVRRMPCTESSVLVFSSRAEKTTDKLSFRTLVAGAGAVVSSKPGAPVCVSSVDDPVGGEYLRINGSTQPVCF